MATNNDARGRPELERFDELPPVIFDTRSQGWLIDQGIIPRDSQDPRIKVPRQRRHRGADEQETMRLIEEAARLYQMTWFPSRKNEALIYMPFQFVRPSTSWKLRNRATGEIYRVANVGIDPTSEHFTGSILLKHERLDSNPLQLPYFSTDPSRERGTDRLEWVDEKGKIVEFSYEGPERTAAELEKITGGADEGGVTPEAFTPTITMRIDRQEPGTLGKRPFDEPRQVRPTFREQVPDPVDPINYTLEVQGWWMDNLLRFDFFSVKSKEVDRLVRWFRNFYTYNEWVLMLNGVQRLQYWDRRADQVSDRYRDRLPWRTVRLYARTEEIFTVRRRNITGVTYNFRVQGRHGPVLNTGESTGAGAPLSQWDFFHDETGAYLGGTIGVEESILPYEFL